MELDDCVGFDDSDVILDNGISMLGRINPLMPRFEDEDTEAADGRGRNGSKKRSTSIKK